MSIDQLRLALYFVSGVGVGWVLRSMVEHLRREVKRTIDKGDKS